MIKKSHTQIISKRIADTHKGNYGHVYVIAGSRGMTGAAYLCSQAALISGSGLVTLAIPESLNSIMEVKLTEVITDPQPETESGTLSVKATYGILESIKRCNSIACGPGLRKDSNVKKLVFEIIKTVKIPLVLDGDALNVVAEDVNILKKQKAPIVITPHPGEMARLVQKTIDEIQKDRINIAKDFAINYNTIVVLKGHKTIVANKEGQYYINETGNPGMATAGSGDVLCGMIASFIGQGIDPYSASKLGVYLHGLSGDIAASRKGQVSLIATDILSSIPTAIKRI